MSKLKRTSLERVAAFSDGVFAVISTIMVLELKPPRWTVEVNVSFCSGRGFLRLLAKSPLVCR
ncbi:TMEM175 family protein [Granulicella mallensis]|uniref:TMEM175 family protein n=1 Tax=Granulicella mallensis TaxID=940614 RepID=UPI0028895E16|nr:TMEM175 family protein [Granulicella mallensis]